MAKEKYITDFISSGEIAEELRIIVPITTYDEKVREVNAALCDVYNSTKLREVVKQMGRPIPLFNFGHLAGREKGKALELYPENYMVVHTGIGNIVYEGFPTVTLEEGILVYGDSKQQLADEICRHGGFRIYKTAQEIRQCVADVISVNSHPRYPAQRGSLSI